jgi:nucleotide-binding universal stress UspA family protein
VHGMTIVGSDGGPGARAAADWSADRAARSGDGVMLVRVVGAGTRGDDAGLEQRLDAARDTVESEASRLRSGRAALRVVVEAVHGDPAEVLRALSVPDAVLALGASSREGRFSSVVERVASTAVGPVAVLPAVPAALGGRCSTGPGTAGRTGTGVVVGIDGTDASLAALVFAADEAARWGEPLEAVHAWLDVVPARRPGRGSAGVAADARSGSTHRWGSDPLTALLRVQHQTLLHEAVSGLASSHPGVVVRERVVQGGAAPVLLEAAAGRRCLVVGDHGRRRIGRFLLGSVSHAVLLAGDGPVVVVRAGGESWTAAVVAPGAAQGLRRVAP